MGEPRLTAAQKRVLAELVATPDSRRHLATAWGFGTQTCAALYRRGLIDAEIDPGRARRHNDVRVSITEAGRRALQKQGDPT